MGSSSSTPVEGYAWQPFAAQRFPGDDGMVDDDVTVTSSLLRLRGRFLIPGAADHTGIKVGLTALDGSEDPQTVFTGGGGEVSFPGVAAGSWRLDVTLRDSVSGPARSPRLTRASSTWARRCW